MFVGSVLRKAYFLDFSCIFLVFSLVSYTFPIANQANEILRKSELKIAFEAKGSGVFKKYGLSSFEAFVFKAQYYLGCLAV